MQQKQEASAAFRKYLAMLPSFAEIYIKHLTNYVRPMDMFYRPLTEFELKLVNSHKVIDSFNWNIVPLLFAAVPQVNHADVLSEIAQILETNDEFRLLLEHDRSYIRDLDFLTTKTLRINRIRVSTISDIGFARYA